MRWINTQEGAASFIREVKIGGRGMQKAPSKNGRGSQKGHGLLMGNSTDDGWARGTSGLLEQETPWKGHCRMTLLRNPLLSALVSESLLWLLTIALRSDLRITLTARLGRVGWGALQGVSCTEKTREH